MILLFLLIFLFPWIASAENGCFFHKQPPGSILNLTSQASGTAIDVAGYFRVYSSEPSRIETLIPSMERAKHFLETELGWKLPATDRQWNRPFLDIVFIEAEESFSGMTISNPGLRIILNQRAISQRGLPDLLIHQLAHAAEMELKPEGEYWFYEATAGWMELLFDSGSKAVAEAYLFRQTHPEIPVTSEDPQSALGVSRFLELISRSNRDVIRQIWQQYSYSQNETALAVSSRVLDLNHLPALGSFLQNYFLSANASQNSNAEFPNTTLAPYSAMVLTGTPEGRQSGGFVYSFQAQDNGNFSPAVISYSIANSGTVSLKRDVPGKWVVQVPYAGMHHYKIVIANTSAVEIKGKTQIIYDSKIPAVLEYFRAKSGEGSVQLEWRTSSENGVAFWNLYRVHDQNKEKLNKFPIPATVDSAKGIHYVYVDTGSGDLYSLEAVTGEGFPAELGTAIASQ